MTRVSQHIKSIYSILLIFIICYIIILNKLCKAGFVSAKLIALVEQLLSNTGPLQDT